MSDLSKPQMIETDLRSDAQIKTPSVSANPLFHHIEIARCHLEQGAILMARTEERIPDWLISALAQLRAAKKTIDNNL